MQKRIVRGGVNLKNVLLLQENVSTFYVVGMKTTSAANAVCCNVIANKIQGRVS